MRKVGLVLACCTNYGALLQAYATQQIIKRLGYETEIIIYEAVKNARHIKFDWGLIPYLLVTKWESYRNSKIIEVIDDIHEENRKERIRVMDEFCNTRLENRIIYRGYENLKKAGASCDVVLLGSDQMWLPGTTFGNHVSLRFVPANVRKVSYATSLGVSIYPWYCRHSAKTIWKRMDYLSVREEQGKRIIQDICGDIPVEVVVDPTYLLTKDQWLELIPFERIEDDKYVLCYFLGNNENSFKCAKNFAKSKGLKLLSILSDESSFPNDMNYADRHITGGKPEDFINLIRGAEYIFTDSFHGLAFSVINEKQFFVLYRRMQNTIYSRNSRIDNILKMWNLQDRLVHDKLLDWNSYDYSPIDYSRVSGIVNTKRDDSLTYLIKALK